MLLQSCDDEHPSQELGSADSPFPDYQLGCPLSWEQDRIASPELFGDAIGLDDNSLPDSRCCSQVPTTQTLVAVRTFEQSWKEPSSQDFGADNSFQDLILSPLWTFTPQQDCTASLEFFGSGISSDADSAPYVPKKYKPQSFLLRLRTWIMEASVITLKRIDSSALSIALPNGGETVQPDSSEQQSLVEFDATNNGHVFSQDHCNSTGSHSKKKNICHSKSNTKATLVMQCRNKIQPSLDDIKQQFGNKRKDAAENLGISESTLKRICRKHEINSWRFHKENKGSYEGMGVRYSLGTSSSAQAVHSAKRSAPTVPASLSQKQIRISSQIAIKGTTSAEYALAKSTGPIIHEIDEHGDDGRTLHQPSHWSQPLRMLSLEKEKYSGFHKSQTSIVEKENKFTDFEEQTREVEGNKGESAGGEDGVEEEEEEKAEGELSPGNSRVREELEEDHDEVEIEMQDADEVQCCERSEIEMQGAGLAGNFIALPANQPSAHHVDIPSLAKEDAIPSKPALISSMTTPKRPPNTAYDFSFLGTSPSHSAHPVIVTSADQTVSTNFPLQGAMGAAAAEDPASSGHASNIVTQQSHLHEISKKSQFLEFEVSSNAFPILMQIQQRFPETFTSFKIKRSEWAMQMLGNLAEFVKSVADTKVHKTSEETMQTMHGCLEDLENMGFSLPWLKARLEDGAKVMKHNENNVTYEYFGNALEKINGDIKKLDENYARDSSELKARKEKLEVDTAKAKAGLEASGRDLPSSLSIGDSLLKGIIM